MSHLLASHAQYAGFGGAMFPPGVSYLQMSSLSLKTLHENFDALFCITQIDTLEYA